MKKILLFLLIVATVSISFFSSTPASATTSKTAIATTTVNNSVKSSWNGNKYYKCWRWMPTHGKYKVAFSSQIVWDGYNFYHVFAQTHIYKYGDKWRRIATYSPRSPDVTITKETNNFVWLKHYWRYGNSPSACFYKIDKRTLQWK